MPLYTKQYMYVYESTLLPLKQSEVRVAFKYYVWAWTDLGLVRLGLRKLKVIHTKNRRTYLVRKFLKGAKPALKPYFF